MQKLNHLVAVFGLNPLVAVLGASHLVQASAALAARYQYRLFL